MQYLWTEKPPSAYPALDGDRQTEVLIIGGGMAGVLCARRLREQGVDCLLVEGKRLGSGMTKGTTAVLTAQHDTLYQDMIQTHGRANAKRYLHANLSAVAEFRALAENIPCDFEEKPSVMYSLTDRIRMAREAETVRSLGFDAVFTTDTPLPFSVAGAVQYNGMAQFHPLKFLYGAAKGLDILENTLVEKLDGTTAVTKRGRITAKKVIVATHYPFLKLRGLYFMKLYQQRSYVIALKNAPQLGCTIEDEAENGIFLRNYKNLLLVGGGTHRTGKMDGGFDIPRAFAKQYFPDAMEQYAWANQDCVSLDGVPYIGAYHAPDVYVATGFNLWGMTSSMVSSMLLTDMVLGKENRFAPAFAPDRTILRKQLLSNLGTTLQDYAIPTTKRCSHLGCALKWNPTEQSWDCPCHGSRFDCHGKLLDNPALRDVRIEKRL